jgi:hypothetical protein
MRVRGDNDRMPESDTDGPAHWPSMPVPIISGTAAQHSVLVHKRQVAKRFRRRDGCNAPLTVRRTSPVYPNRITMGIFSDSVRIHISCCIAY